MGRCQVWGVLNVTPDSFSDGGLHLSQEAAISHGLSLSAAGADVVDVGGESTRPGAERISVEEELGRVIPVVNALAAAGVRVSIDTMRAEVASAAIAAGASIVNDVSGGKADAAMHSTVAGLGVDYVLMHWRGHSDVMNSLANYEDVVSEVISEWIEQAKLALQAGISGNRIWFDPGLGFAKDSEHNWALLQALPQLVALGHPVLIGASRKRFLAEVSPAGGPELRDAATSATSYWSAMNGAAAVRVHDVAGSRAAVAVAERLG